MTKYSTQESIRARLERRGVFKPFSVSGDDTVCSVFLRVASERGGRVAISSNESTLTYSQLESMSANICHAVAGLPVEARRNPVAIMISRHTDFAASMLGVLRAGSFYIPIDPDFPEARIAQMLEVAGVKAVLTGRAHEVLARRLVLPGQSTIYVDDPREEVDEGQDLSVATELACIIFTSGSTGKPKGVMQTHGNLLQVVRRYTNSLCLSEVDRVSLLSSFSVTASIAPMLSSLLNGATLSTFSVRRHGLIELADWLDTSRVTLYHSVPSLFRQLMSSIPSHRKFDQIEVVRMGGDSVRREDWELFAAHCKDSAVFVNSYGCSEMSTVACFYLDRASEPPKTLVPVGFALEGVEISVRAEDGLESRLDASSERELSSDAGEIVLKSRYLSSGYWSNSIATEASFAPSTSERDVRTYRTGDVGVLRGGCGLVHMGRADAQVKIAGFRVEMAEIEACLRKCPGVVDAAVLVATPDHGERELIGFVEVVAGSALSVQDIRAHVHERLPTYMVPSDVLTVANFPRTPNGKLDRAALGALRDSVRAARVRTVAATLTEKRMSTIWAEILGREQVGVDEDFFELGGSSLLGMKLVVRVAEVFGIELPVLAAFEYPSVKQMSAFVDTFTADGLKMTDSSSLSRVEEPI